MATSPDDIQKLLEQQRAKHKKAQQEKRWLLQRGASGAKLTSSLKMAAKRAKKLKTVDICFVNDITASMQPWLNAAAEKMEEIVMDTVKRLGQDAQVRVAFVGYADYGEENHPVVHEFTSDIGQIQAFLRGLSAEGGGDACEDVLTGLEAAMKLTWSSTSRLLFLLSQTPHHGWRFHTDFQVCADAQSIDEAVATMGEPSPEKRRELADSLARKCYDLHGEDPRQWEPMNAALAGLQKKEIQLMFRKVGRGNTLDKMVDVFRRQYQKDAHDPLMMKVFGLDQEVRLFRNLVSSTSSASFSASYSRLSKSVQKPSKRLPLTVSDAPPDWAKSSDWASVEARLISYEVDDLDEPAHKSSRDCRMAICPTPFSKGAMRFAFYVIDEEHQDCRYVGKVYQFDDEAYQRKATYEGDMMSQSVAQHLAKEFSIRYPENPIEFVHAQLLVLETSTLPFKFMALEPWIPGIYEKFTSNAGHIAADSDVAQAFSHFTYEKTGGEILVSDIQGVRTTLTDPQIHSEDVDRFGRGNLRTKGMDLFFSSHVCNEICATLALKPHPFQPGSDISEDWQHLPTLVEDSELPGSEGDMPLKGSKLQHFLDALREDAVRLMESERDPADSDDLGGMVIKWTPAPEISSVVKGSPADLAGCQPEARLRLVGGSSVTQLGREDVLKLLAADRNMILATWSPARLQKLLQVATNPGLSLLSELASGPLDLDALPKLPDGAGPGHRVAAFLALSKLLSDLSESLSELSDPGTGSRKSEFLQAVNRDAKSCLAIGASGEPNDCLGGARIAWKSQPEVVAVEQRSPADGVVRVGFKMCDVDGHSVASLSRREILELLQDAKSISVIGQAQLPSASEEKAAKPATPAALPAAVAPAAATSRFVKVDTKADAAASTGDSIGGLERQFSARDLRKATAEEALKRCESKGLPDLQCHCRGKCGKFVDIGRGDYLASGQFVLCHKVLREPGLRPDLPVLPLRSGRLRARAAVLREVQRSRGWMGADQSCYSIAKVSCQVLPE